MLKSTRKIRHFRVLFNINIAAFLFGFLMGSGRHLITSTDIRLFLIHAVFIVTDLFSIINHGKML